MDQLPYIYEETFAAKYFSTKGRLDRLPYALRTTLLFMVFSIISTILQIFMGGATATMASGRGVSAGSGALAGLAGLLMLVLAIVLVVIFMFLAVRRFHDMNKSGMLAWIFILPILWIILMFVAYFFAVLFFINLIVNIVLYFYLIFKPGTYGPNNFGPDPLYETSLRYCENPSSIPREF